MSNKSIECIEKNVLNSINKLFGVNYESKQLDVVILNIPGFDSFKKVEILLELESLFKVEFTADQIDSFVEIRDIVTFLSRQDL
jgi:acyl carrier protein